MFLNSHLIICLNIFIQFVSVSKTRASSGFGPRIIRSTVSPSDKWHSPCTDSDGDQGYCVSKLSCCTNSRYYSSIISSGTCGRAKYCCITTVTCQDDCPTGKKKVNNSCVDRNECEENANLCSGHKCINTDGSYECECFDSFEMIGELMTCRHVNQSDTSDLLFATFNTIYSVPLASNQSYLNSTNVRMLYSATVSPKSIDFSFAGNYMAWTDITLRQINIAPFNFKNPGLISDRIVLRYPKSPFSLSIDWIHDLVYWTDLETRSINVLNIRKPEEFYSLVNISDKFPQDFLVNVVDSCLVWTYVGFNPKIMRSLQDGTQTEILFSSDEQPFYLTIDVYLKRYFFVNIDDLSLNSIDFEGKDMRKHMDSKSTLMGINKAVISGDNIFLLSDQSINKINKLGIISTDRYTTNRYYYKDKQILDFKIVDPILQPQINNRCQSAQCTHICLPSDTKQVYRCLCPPNTVLINNSFCVEKKFENYLKDSIEWENDLQILINHSISKSIDLRKLFNRTIDQQNTYVLTDSKVGENIISTMILMALIILIIILIFYGFKLKLVRMNSRSRYSSQLQILFRKCDNNNNSVEEIDSK